jgi:hypothetical protein
MSHATRHPLHPVLMRLIAVLGVAGLLGAGTLAGAVQAAPQAVSQAVPLPAAPSSLP